MEKQGTVLSINEGIAEILIERDSACGDNCAACGLCNNKEMRLNLAVGEDIKSGDKVSLISDDKKIVALSAKGYLGLTAFLFGGGVLGTLIGGEWLGFLLALVFVFIGVVLLRWISSGSAEIRIEKI